MAHSKLLGDGPAPSEVACALHCHLWTFYITATLTSVTARNARRYASHTRAGISGSSKSGTI